MIWYDFIDAPSVQVSNQFVSRSHSVQLQQVQVGAQKHWLHCHCMKFTCDFLSILCSWMKGNTIIKLLCCLGVKVEVFEEFGGPVLLVTLAVTPLPAQVTPRILQLQETHPLREQRTHRPGVSYNTCSRWKDRKFICWLTSNLHLGGGGRSIGHADNAVC